MLLACMTSAIPALTQGRFCSSADHPDDCRALVDLGQLNRAQYWQFHRNWLSNESVCDWELVGCNSKGRVKVLALSFNNMTGPMPASIGLLSSLDHMRGELPAESLLQLKSLVEIGLRGESLHGQAAERLLWLGRAARSRL